MKQRTDLVKKPYYRCLLCADFRTICGGMPTRGLDLKGWCEYIRDVMDYIGLSCAHVAKEADVSQRTVERIHAVNIEQDIMRSTCRRIEIVVFGHATTLLCKMDQETTPTEKLDALEKKLAETEKDRDRLAKIIDKFLN